VFTSAQTITVNDSSYQFVTAVIATGSGPRLLSVPGLSAEEILTNQNIFSLATIPARTLIIGAGPIGLEMGQALALLGSQVTIATIDDTFLRLEDEAIRPILQKRFAALGITVELQASIQSVTDQVATFERTGEITETFEVAFDKILVAIGRVPNLPEGLDAAGIKATEQGIVVDSQYRTTNKHVYAVGDVSQRLKFTHTADDTARQVVTRVVSKGILRVSRKKAVPKVTYTNPEIAQVGLSWSEAIEMYGEAAVMRIEVPFSHNDRAKTEDQTTGVLVVIARRITGKIVGAHCIGPVAGELISTLTIAIDNSISLWKLRSSIYAYPTYSLIIKRAGDYFFAKQLTRLRSDIMSILKQHVPKLIALSFWITLIVLFQNYRISNGMSYSDLLLSLITFFTSTAWGPLIYMLLYAVRPLVLFPATLLTALSGTLFGFWWGVLFTVIGENASANFAYWIGRYFGKDSRLENSIIGNWVTALRHKPFETVLFMRLFYVPFDLTNYGSGILKINWSSYFTATLVGIMPGLVTFVALGAALDINEFSENGLSFNAFDPRFLLLSVAIFILSLWLSKVLKRWHAERHVK
jgi:pyruvate/2-oxoglutarate dehydrogenase complex dihydrolipoamide dehydrogenase (E3) component/uncharacterized membrane protein YdjX (TVP38/TMEM64 family)